MNDWFEAEAYVDRALELFERGRWSEAEAELRKALALNPHQAEWHFNLGLTLEAGGRDVEALAAFTRATELLPEETQPAYAAGMTCMRLGRENEALEWLHRVTRMDPRHEAAHAATIDILGRAGRHDEAETAFYLAQQALDESGLCYAAIAESLVHRELFERAEWCLKEALRLCPNLPRVRAQLGRIYTLTNRPHRALQMYLRELRDDPGNIETLLDYGDLLCTVGRVAEAAEKFRRVLELQPANAEAHMRLGEIAMGANRLEQANLEFELVLKLEPAYPDARTCLAETLFRRGRVDEARAMLMTEVHRLAALESDQQNVPQTDVSSAPTDQTHPGRLGKVLLDVGLAAESVPFLEKSISLHGERLDDLRRLALAKYQCGQIDQANALSRRVLRLDDKCVQAMHNLALSALKEGRLRFAAGWIRKGLRINRHDEGMRRLRMRLWIEAATWWFNRLRGRFSRA